MTATIRSGVDTLEGGRVVASRRPGSGVPVLAIHGLTTTRRMWTWVTNEAPEFDFVCADLRGRGESPRRSTPSSIEAHAEDLRQVLDAFELEKVHVLGMSFGASVAVALAALHPKRVTGLTLLDGGLPLPLPAPSPQNVEESVGKSVDRLYRQWPDLATYAAEFTAQTGGALDARDPLLLSYLEGDLRDLARGGPPVLDRQTVVEDAIDLACARVTERLGDAVHAPATLLYAQWRDVAGSAPFYGESYVAQARRTWPWLLHTRMLVGVDHISMGLTTQGAAAAVEAIRTAF